MFKQKYLCESKKFKMHNCNKLMRSKLYKMELKMDIVMFKLHKQKIYLHFEKKVLKKMEKWHGSQAQNPFLL